jgi:hypothetical protein
MSHIKQHKKISKTAYKMIRPYIENRNFPRYRYIRIFDGLLSPDTAHFFKHIKGFDKFNHLNTPTHHQGVEKCAKFYERMQKKSGKKRAGSFPASWFAHYLVDSLEPAHQFEWKVRGNKKESLKNLRLHLWLERKTKKIKMNDVSDFGFVDIENVKSYIEETSLLIKNLNIQSLFPNEKEKILSLYKEVVIPIQIQSVASGWYRVIKISNMNTASP